MMSLFLFTLAKIFRAEIKDEGIYGIIGIFEVLALDW